MRTWQYLSLGDFGMCLFTYLFIAKSRPNRPKTNLICQGYATFVIMDVQVQIFKKTDENQRKPDKNEHENGKCQKPEPGKSNGKRKAQNIQNPP